MIALAAPWTSSHALADWRKIPLALAGRWPRPLPPQTIATDADAVGRWITSVEGAPRFALDVEGTDSITAIGLAAVGGTSTLLIAWPQVDAAHRRGIVFLLGAILMLTPVVGHWVARDIAMLAAEGVVWDLGRIDDSGILHAVRWPGEPHSLVACCGTYGQYGWTKGTPRHTQGDVLGALDVWYGVQRDMPDSVVLEGVELNALRHRYEVHRTTTLPAAIRGWKDGREVNTVPSVDPTWAKEAA